MSLDQITDLIKAKFTRIRTGLTVGFAGTETMDRLRELRGGQWRSVPMTAELPFEDEQFEVVVMSGESVSNAAVKEAHRVLRPEGSLYFSVPEKTGSEPGYTLPDIYAIVREGFNIVGLERSKWWWRFLRRRPTLTIHARKKHWKSLNGTFRPYV